MSLSSPSKSKGVGRVATAPLNPEVRFMSRTSDTFGQHTVRNADVYIKLICRKIKERCSTSRELIYFIRKYKNTNNPRVNKAEFRHTLIKFGIVVPHEILEAIFKVFDSDRSGSIECDEFSHWVMNESIDNVKKIEKSNSESLHPVLPTAVSIRKYSCIKPLVVEGPSTNGHGFGSTATSADRRLKVLFKQNQGFTNMKTAIEKMHAGRDPGSVNPDTVLAAIRDNCGPFSTTDFRLVLSQLKLDESYRVDWKSYLEKFDPCTVFLPVTVSASSNGKRTGGIKSKSLVKVMSIGQFCGF